jgi:hypothetical protein
MNDKEALCQGFSLVEPPVPTLVLNCAPYLQSVGWQPGEELPKVAYFSLIFFHLSFFV